MLDAAGADRLAVIGISATAMTALRLAAEQPERVSHVIVAGGFAEARLDNPKVAGARARQESERMRIDWPAHLDWFFSIVFTEPHSTKPFEDGVRYGWASSGELVDWARNGWIGSDVTRARAPRALPDAGDPRRRRQARALCQRARRSANWCPARSMLTSAAAATSPRRATRCVFNRAVRDFVAGAPRTATWVRAMSRKRSALFISSPIGLGHVQRDLAIARELRKLQPDLRDRLVHRRSGGALPRAGRRARCTRSRRRLANESQHFEHVAGEHDLSAFFALRTMDEIMVSNFMTFSDLMEDEHYDLVIGDEAWDVDYYYHENPELKRQPFVFLTDFVGCLPMEDDEREASLCADRNADDIEHVARFPYVRDAAIFVGNPEDVTEQPFGPGLPSIRAWTDRNFSYSGYALPFDPTALRGHG